MLTNRDQRLANTIPQENLIREPGNENFTAARAFALLMGNQTRTAMVLIQPLANRDNPAPGVIFVYGLILTKDRQKEMARQLLRALQLPR